MRDAGEERGRGTTEDGRENYQGYGHGSAP
jgi:hypothetical protein